jgi:hypothetical protein
MTNEHDSLVNNFYLFVSEHIITLIIMDRFDEQTSNIILLRPLAPNIVTWMARALLGNGPVKTPRPNI